MKKILTILLVFISLASFGQVDTFITNGGRSLIPKPTLFASPTFTGTVTFPTPFTLGATSVTSTGTQLNYLNAATGTTGTASTNLVYSASPTFTGTPTLPKYKGGSNAFDSAVINSTSATEQGNIYLNPLGTAARTGGVWVGSLKANPLPLANDSLHMFGIINDSTNEQMFSMWSFGTGAVFQNNMHYYRSGGTIASPRALLDGATFISIGLRGYDGTNMSGSAASYAGVGEGNWTTSNHGLGWRWQTTPTGSITRSQAMALFGSGDLLLSTGTTDNGHKLEVNAGTLADLKSALKVSATFNATLTNSNNAIDYQITGAGSGAFNTRAFNISYNAGNTGSGTTNGLLITNASAGTAGSLVGTNGNIGSTFIANATTTGHNIGSLNVASGGNVNVGSFGRTFVAKNSATNIGVLGLSLNTGTSPIEIGGAFILSNSNPTFTSTALLLDNGSEAVPIQVWRDNGTEKGRIADGGNLLINTSTDNSTLTVNGSAAFAYVAKTGAYTATSADNVIECTSGTFTVTLPTSVGITGREYWITNTGSGTITIGTTSSQTFINVTATPTTLTVAQFSNYRVVSNGANWLAYKIVN